MIVLGKAGELIVIFFRADGNFNIGSGHIMRCLSIARALSSFESIVFLTADDNFTQVIQSVGIQNHVLNTDCRNLYLEISQMQELIKLHYPCVLFIDSYYVTEFYLNTLWESCRHVGCRLVYIDDLLSFPYPCDILLNYNIYGLDKLPAYQQMYKESRVTEPQFLLGTAYAPLRPEFQNLPARHVRKKAADILVSTGGSDPEHLALQLVRDVTGRCTSYIFHFIIGSMNEDKEAITKLVSECTDGNVVLHHNVTAMSPLMQKMDLAISAAGSTLYELCATQTPALTYILADNQMSGAEGFQNHKILNCVGDYRAEPHLARKLIDAALALADNYGERKRVAANMRMVVDGKGTKRILEVICPWICFTIR